MDSLITFVGDNYVMSAADLTTSQGSIIIMKDDHDKIMNLDSHKLLSASGAIGDVAQFTEYIQKNITLTSLRTGVAMSTRAVAHYTRKELAESLRKSPYQVNLILGGWDKEEGGSCYWIDYLGTLHKVNFIADGYAQYFVLSTMDRFWRKGMGLVDGLELMKKCIDEVRGRLVTTKPEFVVKVVDKDGVRRLGVDELEKVGIASRVERAPVALKMIREAEEKGTSAATTAAAAS